VVATIRPFQVAEKEPSATFLSFFVVAAYRQVRLAGKSAGYPAFLLQGRGGKPTLQSYLHLPETSLCGREASLLRISGLPQTGFRKAQLASACLREAASAEAGPFLSNLNEMTFPVNC